MNNHLQFITDYKTIDEYRLSFNELAHDTFGIDFEKWYQNGCWNGRYICYSYLDNNKIVANVSVNKLNLIMMGKEYQTVQIGTVMTHPDYRGMGLAAQLINRVLTEYEKECEFIFLFGGEKVAAFYPKFGFKPLEEYYSCYDTTMETDYRAHRKLDISLKEDFEIIQRLARERTPISQVFSVKNAEHIITWYCLYEFRNHLYYLEEEDAIAIYKIEGNELHLYDLISRTGISLAAVLYKVGNSKIKKVMIYFTPDEDAGKLGFKKLRSGLHEGAFFISPISPNIPKEFVYPITARA